MKILRIIVGVTLMTAAGAALADGVQTRASAPVVYAMPFSWTGFYVGVDSGYEWKRLRGSDFTVHSPTTVLARTDGSSDPVHQKIGGALGSGHFGYNHQFGHAVLGTEMSFEAGNVRGTRDCLAQRAPSTATIQLSTDKVVCRAREPWQAHWTNKLGYAFGQEGRLLLHVTGGFALTEVKIDRQRTVNTAAGTLLADDWSGKSDHVGVVLGGGAQYALWHNVSVGAEYLHSEFASADYVTTNSRQVLGVGTSQYSSNATQSLSKDEVRFVVQFHFGAN